LPTAVPDGSRKFPKFARDMARHATVSQLAAAMCRGDRVALSRALTLVESKNRQKQKEASQLLSAVLPQRPPQSLRIGISGPPGTGKSTLIEALGGELVSRGHQLAVLAVDPSSQRSGGSIMGDKTRMPSLAVNQRAFIRPSPAQGVLGGVARRTSDAILCCECAGYDRVIVETVGVGQSETAVAGLVDMFVLLVPPAAGDGLQGVKRGIMELADLVVVTKADGALKEVANTMAQDMRSALRVLRPRAKAWAHLTLAPTLALTLTMTLTTDPNHDPNQGL
jgi:LAO/AO transport system kinase